jgi:hypothetical protein
VAHSLAKFAVSAATASRRVPEAAKRGLPTGVECAISLRVRRTHIGFLARKCSPATAANSIAARTWAPLLSPPQLRSSRATRCSPSRQSWCDNEILAEPRFALSREGARRSTIGIA